MINLYANMHRVRDSKSNEWRIRST